MRSIEERAALYGWTVQEVIDHEQHVKAEVATWPPLSEGQKAIIRSLMGPGMAKDAPAQALARGRQPRVTPKAPAAEQLQPTSAPAAHDAVYVIGGHEGHVKIGVSNNPERRARTIGTMSAVPVRLLWSTPGGRELEAALHDRFKDLRLHGEWFDFGEDDPVEKVKAAIAAHLSAENRDE